MTYCIVLPNEVSKHHFVPEKPLIDLRGRERAKSETGSCSEEGAKLAGDG